MNSLLKRQMQKYLPEAYLNDHNLQDFVNSIERSYAIYERQYQMAQRSAMLSSKELSELNTELKLKSKQQEQIIHELNVTINTLVEDQNDPNLINEEEIDNTKTLDYVEIQTQKIIDIGEKQKKLLKELENKNQDLNDFAHMVSHDLKSPLRNISTLCAWLEEDYTHSLDNKGAELINLIRESVVKMDALVVGILEYASIGKEHTDIYDVNLEFVVQEVIDVIYIPKNIKIVIDHALPNVKGNKVKLGQLFQNLIDNAIKYNDKEEGFVHVGFQEKDHEYEFYIRDNGMGIEEVYYDKIFKPFENLNVKNSTGIGLSIVNKIIEFYGGKIRVESEKDKGTTFYFTLNKS